MNILITGGTGSFGQALVAKLLTQNRWGKICIYSRDEHKQNEMSKKFNSEKLRFFIGDVRDKDRLKLAIQDIQVVIHAAALKIVPLAEYNPFEYIKTNVLGSQNLVDACIDADVYPTRGTLKVIALSTDKAVHPINLYGATKLCAEKIFIAANNIRGPSGPRFSVVRYGNVSNSNGSVIPLFRQQIAKGEQLTITDDSMTRFWITLEEATDLVLNALSIMYGGEIFVPEMPSFNIKDLAMVMMQNYPLEKQWCKVIGVRPGEKLHEEIITKEEMQTAMCNSRMYILNPAHYEKRQYEDSVLIKEALLSNSDIVKKLTQAELKEMVNKL